MTHPIVLDTSGNVSFVNYIWNDAWPLINWICTPIIDLPISALGWRGTSAKNVTAMKTCNLICQKIRFPYIDM